MKFRQNFVCNRTFQSVENTSLSSIPGKGDSSVILIIITGTVMAILSPVTVAGNSLVLAAIWRNPSFRTSTYLLLAVLGFSDLCTGFITQPSFVALWWTRSPFLHSIALAILAGFGSYFSLVTVLTLTIMSVERWLVMSRRPLATARRLCKLLLPICLVPIPMAVSSVLSSLRGSERNRIDGAIILFMLLCLVTMSLAYFKVFQIIRRHQQQIQACTSRNNGQPAINLAKCTRSAFTILYILLSYASYLPYVLLIGARLCGLLNDHSQLLSAALGFLFASSSVNPFLYYWRMKDIRDGVRPLLKKLCCKET